MICIRTTDDNLISLSSGGKLIFFQYSPFLPQLEFPLSVRKKCHGIFTFQKQKPYDAHPLMPNLPVPGQLMAEAEAWENISVPAGKFRTLKINYLIDDMESGSKRSTWWYSPEVKRFVVGVSPDEPKGNFELIKFKVNK